MIGAGFADRDAGCGPCPRPNAATPYTGRSTSACAAPLRKPANTSLAMNCNPPPSSAPVSAAPRALASTQRSQSTVEGSLRDTRPSYTDEKLRLSNSYRVRAVVAEDPPDGFGERVGALRRNTP
jgi:hypothetical protein